MNDSSSRILCLIIVFWSATALGAVCSGLFAYLPVFAAQIAIGIQMAVFFGILIFAPKLRRHLLSRDLRLLTLFHLWRLIPGSLFLYYYYFLHELPWRFAVIGGCGDILVGLTAIPLSFLTRSLSRFTLFVLLLWQVLAFLDLAGVVRTALVNALRSPDSMRPLTHFPLSFLPSMLVPLTFMAHVLAVPQLVSILTGCKHYSRSNVVSY